MNNYTRIPFGVRLKSPAIMVAVFYSAANVGAYTLWRPEYTWARVLTGILLVLAVILITRLKLWRRQMAVAVPLTFVAIELVTSAIIGGNPYIFIFLTGTAILSLMYMDIWGLAVKMIITMAAVLIVSQLSNINIMGASVHNDEVIFQFFTLILVYFVIFLVGKYSIGMFRGLRQTEHTFVTFLERSANLIIIVNNAGRVEYISGKLAHILGFANQSYVMGLPFIDLFRGPELRLRFGNMLSQHDYIEDTVTFTLQGEKHHFSLHSTPIQREGIARIFECADITPMVEARETAEASDASKTKFLANMSHEIRTPLTAVISISELELLKTSLPEDYADSFNRIYKSGSDLLRIINDILDLTKIDAGKYELKIVPYHLPNLLNDVISVNELLIHEKPIAMKPDISNALPAMVKGDELHIKKILNNLLSNAIKYTDKGEVTLRVHHTETDAQVILYITVADTGQGMTPSDLKKLNERYTRFNLDANRNIEGAGLGMSITQELVTLMGGTIEVESTHGVGTTFTLTLPQGRIEDANQEPTQKEKTITRHLMPYGRVLVVDDSDMNIYIAEKFLSLYNLQVDTLDNGAAVITNFVQGNTYDIIFMDHMMPGMDGIETTRRLRGINYSGCIIALTANALVGNAEMFMENGFNGFLSKPIDAWQLNELLNKHIRDRHPEAAKAQISTESFVPTSLLDSPLLANAFRRDAQKAIATMPTALSGGDLHLLTITAHAMKSGLANVGEHSTAQAAANLENAALRNDENYLRNYVPLFISALQTLLETLPPEEAEQKTFAEQDDQPFLEAQFAIIRKACEDYDGETAFAALHRLDERSWTPHTTAFIADIRQVLYADSDFEGVAARL